ncbi:MAG: ParB/RepB/Spo0J family partition protein [Candidatus Saccharimonadales bacterium]|jgi:ParB family chromosome partitioning protein
MSAKSGLGKGLDSLIPQDFNRALLADETERVQQLAVNALRPLEDQPRTHFDRDALQELASSLKQYGVLQPLIVTREGRDNYVITAGERRWRAAKLAKLTSVPAIVRTAKEQEQLEIALIENVQRVDLSALEQAASVERLHQQFNLTYSEVAKKLGKAETTISNIVRLLQLPEVAKVALQTGEISEGHARQILALKATPEHQLQLLRLITKNNWTVRQAEQFVSSLKKGLDKTTVTATKQTRSQTPETKRLAAQLHTPVSIRRTAKGGKIEIAFAADEELKQLLALLAQLSRKP